MHRKIVVVDREIAFVGGINIIADGEKTDAMPPRQDFAIALQGPLVDVIRLFAQRLWSMVAWNTFRQGTVRARDPAGFDLHRGDNERSLEYHKNRPLSESGGQKKRAKSPAEMVNSC